MDLKKQILLIIAFTFLAMSVIGFVSWQKKDAFIKNEIIEFQQKQLSYVNQVVNTVEMRLTHLYDDLYTLSQRVEVQFLKKNTCMLNMIHAFKRNQQLVEGIYRMDAKQNIRYAYPLQACPVKGEQLNAMFEHCRRTGKSLFRVIRQRNDGSDHLVIAVPVYTIQGDVHLNPSNKFSGIVFFMSSLNRLQEYFFSAANFGERGYPWIITEEMLLLCTVNASHIGKRFPEFLSTELPGNRSHDILEILARMTSGDTGLGQYSYAIHDNVTADVTKLVAFAPLNLPHQTWAIAVSNLRTEVVEPLNLAVKQQRFYVGSLFFIVFSMGGMAIFLIIRNHALQMNRLQAKEKENLLIRREWQLTFDAMDSMIFLLDRDFKIIRANKTTADMCGISMADLVGMPLLELLFEPDMPMDENPVCLAATTGRVHSTKIRSTSLNRLLLFTALPMDAAPSMTKSIEIICYAKDITAMEEIQEKLNQAQKMESIGLMAGGVAHDLNNLLSAMVGYPEMLLLDLPMDSTLRAPLKAIQESGKRAVDVVADLLTVARGVAAERICVDINKLVRDHQNASEVKTLKERCPGILWSMDLASDFLNIQCSPVHIKKCLTNIMITAAQSISGDGHISLFTRRLHLDGPLGEHQSLGAGDYVVVEISDTGGQISSRHLDRIFEPFYIRKVMGRTGTGLEMAVVWNTMKEHGGAVRVTSTETGTTFLLYLPASGAGEEIQGGGEIFYLETARGNGETILVVDDEPQQRDIASQMLERLGYVPHAVSSGEKAVAYLRDKKVDLLILDMIMDPGMNGRCTYEAILERHPGQKAIIASGYSENEEVAKALALGAGRLLKKPYTIHELAMAVKTELIH